jgi:hypothetical protein
MAMRAPDDLPQRNRYCAVYENMNPRRAFTPVELLVVIAIMRGGMLYLVAGQHRNNPSTDFSFGHRFAHLF